MSNNQAGGQMLAWAQVDVFADAPYQGNALAIFPDATGLSDAQMQMLARETNLSETTFVLPQDAAHEQADGIRVRIFTTQEELPFAGHPTLGTASWLRLHRPELLAAREIVLQLNVGRVTVQFPENTADAGAGLVAEMLQPEPRFLGGVHAEEVASALGLLPTAMHATLLPEVVTTGLPFLIAPLRSLAALDAVQPNFALLTPLIAPLGAKFVYCLAQDAEGGWEARMPFYGADDPATGSAAGCAISYLVAHGVIAPGESVTIRQGRHAGRPSRILVSAARRGDSVHEVRVRGCTIPVAQGLFLRP